MSTCWLMLSLSMIMTAYPTFYFQSSKTTALLLAAIVLYPGSSASGSLQEECTGDDLNVCTAPAIRNEHPITSLNVLLQSQCSESQDDCHLVRRNACYSTCIWRFCRCMNMLICLGVCTRIAHNTSEILNEGLFLLSLVLF